VGASAGSDSPHVATPKLGTEGVNIAGFRELEADDTTLEA
jgi:hypothetical protein